MAWNAVRRQNAYGFPCAFPWLHHTAFQLNTTNMSVDLAHGRHLPPLTRTSPRPGGGMLNGVWGGLAYDPAEASLLSRLRALLGRRNDLLDSSGEGGNGAETASRDVPPPLGAIFDPPRSVRDDRPAL